MILADRFITHAQRKSNLSLPLGEGGALAPDEVLAFGFSITFIPRRFAATLISRVPRQLLPGRSLMVKQRSSVNPEKHHSFDGRIAPLLLPFVAQTNPKPSPWGRWHELASDG